MQYKLANVIKLDLSLNTWMAEIWSEIVYYTRSDGHTSADGWLTHLVWGTVHLIEFLHQDRQNELQIWIGQLYLQTQGVQTALRSESMRIHKLK